MDESRSLLKWACFVNGVTALLALFASPILGIVMGALILFVFNISEESDTVLSTRSKILTFIGIVFLITNFLSGILVFIAIGKLKGQPVYNNSTNSPPKKIVKKVIDPEIRKIDILLKLGVGMVLVSGILFATTTWEYITNEMKVGSLLFLAFLFLALSIFSEKRLKVFKTTYMYWLLSMSFFILTIVGTLHFGIFNDELTYVGSMKELTYAITFFTISGLTLASYLKFSKDYFIYCSYLSMILTIYNFLSAFLEPMNSIMIISILLLLGNIFNKKYSKLLEVTKLTTYLSFIFIFLNMKEASNYFTFTSSIINMINLYYLTIYDDNDTSILSLIVTLILSVIAISSLELEAEVSNIIMFIYITIHTLLIKYDLIKQTKDYQNVNYAFYSIISIINYLSINLISKELAIIIPTGYLLINIISGLGNNKIEYTHFLIPVSILIEIYSILNLIPERLSISYTIAIASVIYCIIHCILKDEEYKKLYTIIIGISIIAILESNIINKDVLPTLIALIPSIYLFFISYQKRLEEKASLVISYLLLLLTIHDNLTITNILNVNIFISSIIFIWIITMIILLIKEEIIKKVSFFAIIIPLYEILEYPKMDVNLKAIATSVLILYAVFLIIKFVFKDNDIRNLLGVVGIIASLIPLVFNTELLVGLYIGIVGIIVIIIGYHYSKELPSFFITGIIITIVNIIYQLKDLWEQIPFWLYLLVGGLSIIGFVTYKEVLKISKKENKNEETK